MRCLTLADALRERGAHCTFICRRHPGHLMNLIRQRGHEVIALSLGDGIGTVEDGPSHAAWLGTNWSTDADQTREATAGQSLDWLVVDHYALDRRWEQVMRPRARRILVIDDLADRPHDCDLLIDQNWHAELTAQRYLSFVSPTTMCLLGPKYVLLSPEYAALRHLMPSRDGLVRRLLVFMGGSDPNNETVKVLKALMVDDLASLVVDVVIGENHPDIQGVESMARDRPYTVLHKKLPSLAGLMARADLMIGAGGTTTWERMCLGLPCLVISIAHNQTETQRALMAAGCSTFLGEMSQVTPETIANKVRWALRNPIKLIEQSRLSQSFVDGCGVDRVANMMDECDDHASTTPH